MGRDALIVRRAHRILLATASAVVVLDQATKWLVRENMRPGDTVAVIDGLLSLSYVRNTGAAFGLMSGYRPLFVLTSAAVLVGIWLFLRALRPTGVFAPLALGLIAGGALGNLLDRLFLGRVTDFVDVHFWPVFNVADSGIFVGVGLLAGWLLLERPDPGDEAPAAGPAEDAGEPGDDA